MKNNVKEILDLINKIQTARIYCSLRSSREDAISLDVTVPGQRWEIDFLEDGSTEIEIFTSDGTIYDESKLNDLFNEFSD